MYSYTQEQFCENQKQRVTYLFNRSTGNTICLYISDSVGWVGETR